MRPPLNKIVMHRAYAPEHTAINVYYAPVPSSRIPAYENAVEISGWTRITTYDFW